MNPKNKNKNLVQPEAGDIIYCCYPFAQKRKYAIVLEPKHYHFNKPTVNVVILTTRRLDRNYPFNHHLSIKEQIRGRPSKVICDQPTNIIKDFILRIEGKVSEKTLEEIRKKTTKNISPKHS